MAATIAKAIGYTGATRHSTSTRLGSRAAEGQANTWRTFATVYIWPDGHGSVEVKRDGEVILYREWEKE